MLIKVGCAYQQKVCWWAWEAVKVRVLLWASPQTFAMDSSRTRGDHHEASITLTPWHSAETGQLSTWRRLVLTEYGSSLLVIAVKELDLYTEHHRTLLRPRSWPHHAKLPMESSRCVYIGFVWSGSEFWPKAELDGLQASVFQSLKSQAFMIYKERMNNRIWQTSICIVMTRPHLLLHLAAWCHLW